MALVGVLAALAEPPGYGVVQYLVGYALPTLAGALAGRGRGWLAWAYAVAGLLAFHFSLAVRDAAGGATGYVSRPVASLYVLFWLALGATLALPGAAVAAAASGAAVSVTRRLRRAR